MLRLKIMGEPRIGSIAKRELCSIHVPQISWTSIILLDEDDNTVSRVKLIIDRVEIEGKRKSSMIVKINNLIVPDYQKENKWMEKLAKDERIDALAEWLGKQLKAGTELVTIAESLLEDYDWKMTKDLNDLFKRGSKLGIGGIYIRTHEDEFTCMTTTAMLPMHKSDVLSQGSANTPAEALEKAIEELEKREG